MATDTQIESHWAPPADRGQLLPRILDALASTGADLERLTPEQLAPVDEFHLRGRDATRELIDFAGIPDGAEILDIGSGLGGPSRFIASEKGCRITGVDLTEEYCQVARSLAELTGLSEHLTYRRANALELPFEDGAFDWAWTQHASMNIADKQRLFSEMKRVLRPGGRLVIYDPIAGPEGGPLHLPVPWAREPGLTFLMSAENTRAELEAVGFEVMQWRSCRDDAVQWLEGALARSAAHGPPALGFHLLLGADWPAMAANMLRNLEEGRLDVMQTVLRR